MEESRTTYPVVNQNPYLIDKYYTHITCCEHLLLHYKRAFSNDNKNKKKSLLNWGTGSITATAPS
ncbi:MAG: hypothetical protein J6Q73_05820 [Bacteroidaceae bacterium]|nr:hypothetical protein [Bacteroidaceae bacterium]